ncbi:DUF131 domain-containing protein [Candidatus Woesearchaeota archaeon]|nr:DUF131 domain-containing protein [Candidatus Woesearchaeota archaeon]
MVKHLDVLSIGLLVMAIGFLIVLIGSIYQLFRGMERSDGNGEKSHSSNVKFSFIGFIGPFPFGFGNDKKFFVFTLFMALAIGLVFLVGWLFLRGKPI